MTNLSADLFSNKINQPTTFFLFLQTILIKKEKPINMIYYSVSLTHCVALNITGFLRNQKKIIKLCRRYAHGPTRTTRIKRNFELQFLQ